MVTYYLWAESQDHKPRNAWNTWPNTWWMWAYTPVKHLLTDDMYEKVIKTIVEPTVVAMKNNNTPFSGFLYVGLMITKNWPQVLEYNVRFWDPEAQPIMSRLESDFLEMCLAWSEWKLDQLKKTKWSTKSAVNVVLAAKSYPEWTSDWEQIIIPEWINKKENLKVFHAWTKIDKSGTTCN